MGARSSRVALLIAFLTGVGLSSLVWLGSWSQHSMTLEAALRRPPPVTNAMSTNVHFVPGGLTEPAARLTGGPMLPKAISPPPPPGTVEPAPMPGTGGDTPTPGPAVSAPPELEIAVLPLDDPPDHDAMPQPVPEPVPDVTGEPPLPGPVDNPPMSDPVPEHALVP